MLCRPFRAHVAEDRIDPQGVALGCCSLPLQGKENAPRIGRSEGSARGNRESTSEPLSRMPEVSRTRTLALASGIRHFNRDLITTCHVTYAREDHGLNDDPRKQIHVFHGPRSVDRSEW